jgi:hypothetical protein
MSKDREASIIERLESFRGQEMFSLVGELLSIKRERYRDCLEREERAEVRGKAKECKDLLQIFG